MSGRYEWIECGSELELARMAADRWLGQTRGGRCCVALSGGRIARRFFDSVVVQVGVRGPRLESTEFFWADERCVPPEHVDSNYQLAKVHLLDPIGVRTDRIHRLQGERDPAEAAKLAEAELRRLAEGEVNGQPVLDLVFLGMGEDGHVASLFPGAQEDVLSSQATYLPVIGPKPPPRRLTLSYGALAVAREVWVLVSGAGKEGALSESVSEEGRTPLARLLRSRQNTLVFSDLKLEVTRDC